MIYHHTGSKDTYITNKIVAGTRRATGGNVGYASTIDLFKLYGENTLKGYKGTCDGIDTDEQANCSGTWDPNLKELSRGLIYFDLDALKTELDSMVDVSDSSFKLKLVMKDIQGTQVAPSNFTLQLWASTVDWDEGIGDDVSSFSNIQATNWLSSSLGTLWDTAGGTWETSWIASDDGVDPVDSRTYVGSQDFVTGWEDLEIDVTDWARAYWSATNTDVTNNYGWFVKFDTEETDNKSYFVKRFASRHTRNPFLRPKLVAYWEDYHFDDRLDFKTNVTNSLSIRDFSKGTQSALSAVPTATLSYGTWSSSSISSAVSSAGISQVGMYEAEFGAFDLFGTASDLRSHLLTSGSILLQEQWSYDDGSGNSVLVHSGSFDAVYPLSSTSASPRDYRFSILDLKSTYDISETPKVRLFVRERNLANEPVRIPIELKSHLIHKAYYQIKDTNSLLVLIPFSDQLSTPDESTRISADAEGMYFSFPVSVLPRGRTYTIDIAFYDRSERRIYESNMAFKVK